MGLTQLHLMTIYSIAIVLVLSLTFASGDDIILQKRSENDLGMQELHNDDILPRDSSCNPSSGCQKSSYRRSKRYAFEMDSKPQSEELRHPADAPLVGSDHGRQRDRPFRAGMAARNMPLELAMSNFRRKRAATTYDQISRVSMEENESAMDDKYD